MAILNILYGCFQRQEIASLMLPAYKGWVPTEEVVKSISLVSRILPPLSDEDAIRLSVMLPLLAESLENGNLPSPEEPGISEFEATYKDLATYALNSEYDARSRSAASSCMFSYIVHLAKKDSTTCPSKLLLEEIVMPAIVEASSEKGVGEKLSDLLNLSSILVSLALETN